MNNIMIIENIYTFTLLFDFFFIYASKYLFAFQLISLERTKQKIVSFFCIFNVGENHRPRFACARVNQFAHKVSTEAHFFRAMFVCVCVFIVFV